MTTASLTLTIIGCIIAYLIGSISPAIIIMKYYFKINIRDYFSKNAGATNVARVTGPKVGLLILVLDGLKTGLVLGILKLLTLMSFADFSQTSIYISAIFIVFGHCFPIYYKFKGGKGIGPFLGLMLFLNPIYFLIATVVWWGIFFILRIVSISSLLCVISVFCCSWIFKINLLSVNMWINHQEVTASYLLPNFWTPLIIGNVVLIVIIRHYQNIYRIFTNQEAKITFNN